jgi:hypothetical protein
MLEASLMQELPLLSPPVLTLYLDTNPAEARNQRWPSGARIWLKSRAQVLSSRIAREEQKLFGRQVERVDRFLATRARGQRGLVLFAGPDAWRVLPMSVAVEDELHWGRPSLTQLLWLLDEHQPAGAIVAGRSGARFLRLWMGEAEERAALDFSVDTTQWRRKMLVGASSRAVQKIKGAHRDEFEQRVEVQFARLLRDCAAHARDWMERDRLSLLLVAGPNATVEPLWAELPTGLTSRAALVKGDLGGLSPSELTMRLETELARLKRATEAREVEQILGQADGARAVAGLDETLRKLQQGAVRALLVARGLGGKLKQCARCRWTDRSADPQCASCGGEKTSVALRAVLPELARRHGVTVEVVAGEAAAKLRGAGGLAAWLR